MTEGKLSEDQPQPADAPTPNAAEPEALFVRQRKPHKTVEPVDDFAVDEPAPLETTGPTPSGRRGVLSGLTKDELPQLQRDVRYGNYLEVPRSSHKIFSSRGRSRRIKTLLASMVVIAVVVIVGFVLWHLIQGMR